MNLNRPTPRHIIIKMEKVQDKERNLKVAKEKQRVSYKGTPIKLLANFSAETLSNKVMKRKNLQPRILYPARLSFRLEEEIKDVSDKQKLKEYSTTKPNLKEILKGLL